MTLTFPPRQLDPEDLEAVKRISKQLWQTAEDHGFHDLAVLPGERDARRLSFGERLTLITSELSEAYEEYRAGKSMQDIHIIDGKPEGIPIEIADAWIRLADLVIEHKVPIAQAIATKDRFNQTRPMRHGKAV